MVKRCLQQAQVAQRRSLVQIAKSFAHQGKTLKQMAQELSLNYVSLKQALIQRGYQHPYGIELVGARIEAETSWVLTDYIKMMVKEGLVRQQIASDLGVDSMTVKAFCERNGIIIPPGRAIPRSFEKIIAAIRRRTASRSDLQWIEHNGEKRYLSQWAEITGIGVSTLKKRLKLGWTVSETLTTKVGKARKSMSMRTRPRRAPSENHPWREAEQAHFDENAAKQEKLALAKHKKMSE